MNVKRIRVGIQVGIVFVLILTFLSTGMSAMAAEEYSDRLDPTRSGSISLTIKNPSNQAAVKDAVLTCYKVADAKEDNGDYFFEYTGDFQDCMYDLGDLSNDELAGKLKEYVSAKKLTSTNCKTDENGKVSFRNLEVGLYLVIQTGVGKSGMTINPFLISVPIKTDQGLCYDVDGMPKTGVKPPPSTPSEPPGLPQTGQLWWPVPILSFAGVLFIILGWKKHKNAENES